MNVCIERTNDDIVTQGVLSVNPRELLIVSAALKDFTENEERHFGDRAKALWMRIEIGRELGGEEE